MTEFFAMGGYAFYVWLSVALTAVVLLFNIIIPLVRHKRLLQELRRSLERDAGVLDARRSRL